MNLDPCIALTRVLNTGVNVKIEHCSDIAKETMDELYLIAYETDDGYFYEENLTKQAAEEMYIKNKDRVSVQKVFICIQLKARIETKKVIVYE